MVSLRELSRSNGGFSLSFGYGVRARTRSFVLTARARAV
jgi:hypothetical protein